MSNPQQRSDGNLYYVIGGQRSGGGHITIVDNIKLRNQCGADGFVFVKDATGDPTVHNGWAMYFAATNSQTKERVWIKVAEMESVDGPWGINETLLRNLVARTEFEELKRRFNESTGGYFEAAKQVEFLIKWIGLHGVAVPGVNGEPGIPHANKADLDKFSSVNGILVFDGKPVGVSLYNYDRQYNDQLVWADPTDEDLVVDATTVNVIPDGATKPAVFTTETSAAIADAFCECQLAPFVRVLQVRELDGSVTSYQILRSNDDKYSWVYLDNVGGSAASVINVTFVPELPQASASYVGRGLFCIVPPAIGGYRVGDYYECVASTASEEETTYSWKNLSERLRTGRNAFVDAPVMQNCVRASWNTARMTWIDPEDVEDGPRWDKTVIVRKIGSAPQGIDDGVIIKVSKTRNAYNGDANVFEDTYPINNDSVFYGAFAVTKNGAVSSSSESIREATFLTWEMINEVFERGELQLYFKVGDTIVLPKNGDDKDAGVEYKITEIRNGGFDSTLHLEAVDNVAVLPFDGPELAFTPVTSADQVYEGPNYYVRDTESAPAGMVTYRLVPYTSVDVNAGNYYMGEGVKASFMCSNDGQGNLTGIEHGSRIYSTMKDGVTKSYSNIHQWLNGKGTNWFTPRDATDANAIEATGFLSAFEDVIVVPADGSTPAKTLVDMIRWVELPFAPDGVVEPIPVDYWTVRPDDNTPTTYVTSTLTDPEVALGVRPVIVLGQAK